MYILRRLLIFIPMLFAISLLAFIISVNAPGDPVERLLTSAETEGAATGGGTSKLRQELRHRLGLDLPVFYFSIVTTGESDTLHHVPERTHRETLERLARTYGNWPDIVRYYRELQELHLAARAVESPAAAGKAAKEALSEARFATTSLFSTWQPRLLQARFDSLNALTSASPFLEPVQHQAEEAAAAWADVQERATPWKTYLPALNWYGHRNQYHRWVFGDGNWLTGAGAVNSRGILRGDFGISYQDQRKISERIMDRFWWSFTLTIISILLAYLVSLPIGIYAAYRRNSLFDRSAAVILFVLYSLPNFFVGTMLLFLFANPEFMYWFPVSGVRDLAVWQEEWSLWQKAEHIAPYLVLPILTFAYSSFAFLSRQMRVGMIEALNQDYIRTARAKGLPERQVVLKHAFRNALLPIITVFANVFPLVIGGSVIVETIFSIPGMGLEIYHSILSYDYPMVIAIFTLTGFLTLLGYLVADILYALADPRISLEK